MRKLFIAAAAAILVPSLILTHAHAAPFVTKTLQEGSQGKEVETLQKILKENAALYPEGLVTGYFGPLTKRAVEKLQQLLGLESVGVVGPKTRSVLNRYAGREFPRLSAIASCENLVARLEEGKRAYRGFGIDQVSLPFALPAPRAALEGKSGGAGPSYSTTNIQVAGVDEADIVKTDGAYIYSLSKNGLAITKAYPAEEARLVARITTTDVQPQELFVYNNMLVVFGQKTYSYPLPPPVPLPLLPGAPLPAPRIVPPPPYAYPRSVTAIRLYDVSDRARPTLARELEFEGTYTTSRLIGSYVYAVLNGFPHYQVLEDQPVAAPQAKSLLPLFRDSRGRTAGGENEFVPVGDCRSVLSMSPVITNQYLVILAVPLENTAQEIGKKVILGAGENTYVSEKNLYVAYGGYDHIPFALPQEFRGDQGQKTILYKFELARGEIRERGSGSVPGRVLNQFSMDEYDGSFRIATTKDDARFGGMRGPETPRSTNNVYVLDENLRIAGALQDIAPGERIYSARFMGNKGYLVTFKKVDPFFTIDLSDPRNPRVIGQLKIPGYSDYLHPYDENHVIGIGKEAIEAEGGDFAWYQGMKIALFDVTDFANPRELSSVAIGDRGTDSPLLRDHKALLFEKNKNLFVIPILLAEIPAEQKRLDPGGMPAYGTFTFQGTYVYRLTLDQGFELKGKITHFENDEAFRKSGYYWGSEQWNIERSIFIGNNLYTISKSAVKINRLGDLTEIKTVAL